MGTDSHLNIRAAFVGRDVHALLRDLLGKKPKKTTFQKQTNQDSEVVASYSTSDGTLTLSSFLYGRLPIEFHLRPNSRSYESFLRMLLEELKKMTQEEHLAGRTEDASSVSQLTSHLEKRIRSFAAPAPRTVQGLAQVIDVFRDDVEAVREKKIFRALTRPLLSHQGEKTRGFRYFDPEVGGPQFISGFVNLEVDRVAPTSETSAQVSWREVHEALKRAFRVLSGRLLEVQNGRATIEFVCELPTSFFENKEVRDQLGFFLHWGRYAGSMRGWWDQEVPLEQFERLAVAANSRKQTRRFLSRRRMGGQLVQVETIRLRKELPLEFEAKEGAFGVVLSAQFQNQKERCWGKIPGVGDLRFHISPAQSRVPQGVGLSTKVSESESRADLATYERFLAAATESVRESRTSQFSRRMGRLLVENPLFGKNISRYFKKACSELEDEIPQTRKRMARAAVDTISNLGVGSVALVAPEGPQAIAGGLAQVIVGLTSVFKEKGIETVIISPLYEEAQGNKHKSAAENIRDGITLAGEKSELVSRGKVLVPFGPELRSGSDAVTLNPFLAEVEVYEARAEGVRALFLRHRRFANSLYAACESDEQVRKAIFLSRAALEILGDSRFDVSVDAVLTNDWLAGLVPVYLKTHQRYSAMPGLKGLPVIHLLHNCGQAYQGRFYANQYGQDIWPLLDLPTEHFFGLSDPNDRRYLNLTAGAAFHTSGALLAVSKPYADSLLTEEGGEGLHQIFGMKKDILFGVSNGIDLDQLRRFTWKVGEMACEQVGRKSSALKRYRSDSMITRLEDYKSAAKLLVQRENGLIENSQTTLLSMVGRIAEQKGVHLLAEKEADTDCSVMESLLREFPCVQFLFAGPLSPEDPAAKKFAQTVEMLVMKYPGRIQRQFSFLPHQKALEITLASSLFLMPSRYEPGGITQLEALACGTPVVARRVGGIQATVEEFNPKTKTGTGFLFETFEAEAFHDALRRAIVTIGDIRQRSTLIRSGALAENDWSNRAESYLAILQQVTGALCPTIQGPIFKTRRDLLSRSRAGRSVERR